MNIISLVPSITYTLIDLGFPTDKILGRTKFCIHPKPEVLQIPIVGGTKNIHIDKILCIAETNTIDLIIANKEENEKESIETLSEKFPVWVTEIASLSENEIFIQNLIKKCKLQAVPDLILQNIRQNLHQNKIHEGRKTCAYIIWKKPWMVAGGDTYISSVLEALGYTNIFKNSNRYPIVEVEDIMEADCIFISSEPFPFGEQDKTDLEKILQLKKKFCEIHLVSGEYFSWFGSYLSKNTEYLLAN